MKRPPPIKAPFDERCYVCGQPILSDFSKVVGAGKRYVHAACWHRATRNDPRRRAA